MRAPIERVERYKNYLFIYNALASEPQLIQFFTNKGAFDMAHKIRSGHSIDASMCMAKDELLSTEVTSSGNCSQKTYSNKLDCGRFSSISFVDADATATYETRDIVAHPLQSVENECIGTRGSK